MKLGNYFIFVTLLTTYQIILTLQLGKAIRTIDWKGFEILSKKNLEQEYDAELWESLSSTKNNNGSVGVADLRFILKGLGDDLTKEEIDDMIADVDTDGDGTVDYEEFKSLMNSN